MDTGLNVELHHLAEGVLVEMVIGRHRRDNGRENPSEFVHLALSFVFMAESCASHYVTDGCRCLCTDKSRPLLLAIQPIARYPHIPSILVTTQPYSVHHHAEQTHAGTAGVSPATGIRDPERAERCCFSLLTPLPSLLVFGRSGLRPSLVRGDSPRNAPLKTRPRHRTLQPDAIVVAMRQCQVQTYR